MLKSIKKLEYMFVLLALVGGIAFALINPPFQECDGWDHFVCAMDVSYGNWFDTFGNFAHDSSVTTVPENFQEITDGYKLVQPDSGEAETFIQYYKSVYFSNKTAYVEYARSKTTFFYWPQAIGLLMGRCLGFSVYWCVFLSRIVNLFVYVAITFAAIRLMPVCRNLFTLIALFPLTLYQAASDSTDALLNALCFLFIALCFHYAYDCTKECTWKDMVWLGVLLALIFISKYVYICIGLLVFMIPKERFSIAKNYWKSFAIALIPVAAIVVFLTVRVLAPMETAAQAQVVAGAVEMTQTQYLLQHPLHLVKVLISTALTYMYYYVQSMGMLGSLNYPMTVLFVVQPAVTVFVACLDTDELSKQLKRKDRLLCLLAFVLTVCALCTALYIGDTRINPVGSEMIAGIQGRYFFPVLVLAFIPFVSKNVENKIRNFEIKVVSAAGGMLLYAIVFFVRMCY